MDKIIIKNFLDIEGLDIFVNPKSLLSYELCVGWDTSTGLTEDSLAGVEFIDLKSGIQIMEFNNKYDNKTVIEKMFLPLYKEIPELRIAIINIERNHLGIDAIVRIKDFYQQIGEKLGIEYYPYIYKDKKGKEGYWTSRTTKEYLISIVLDFLKENQLTNIITSKRFVKELFSLTSDKGKIKTSYRNDLVIAMGLALIGRLYYIEKFLKYDESVNLSQEEKELIFDKQDLPLPDTITIDEHLHPNMPYKTDTLVRDFEKFKQQIPLLERITEKQKIFDMIENITVDIDINVFEKGNKK